MSKIVPNLDNLTIEPTEGSLTKFVNMLRKIYTNLALVVNGNLGFGDGTHADNINGVWSNLTAPAAPNTDFTITHNLGRIPVGYLVMEKDRACDVYTGSVAVTKTQLTLRATVASAVLRLFIIGLLLFLIPVARTQTTNVTLQVTDSGAQTWNNGTWSVVLSGPLGIPPGPSYTLIGSSTPVPNQTQNGVLGATGSSGTITLTQNAGIAPNNSQWRFTVCPQATSLCFSQFVTITSATSVTITPPAILIAPGPGVSAYSTTEISGGTLGSTFFLLGTGLQNCIVVSGSSCTTWTNVAGSGGGNVSNSGTPSSGQLAQWVDATHVSGVSSITQNTTGTSAGLSLPSGTASLGTTAIASGACATVVTVTATGLTTATGTFSVSYNGDPTAVTGYGASATGAVLTIYPYPTAGNINFKVCNSTANSITPGALTLNWQVTHL